MFLLSQVCLMICTAVANYLSGGSASLSRLQHCSALPITGHLPNNWRLPDSVALSRSEGAIGGFLIRC
jgi:hypothetical protein